MTHTVELEEIEKQRVAAVAGYPALWARMISEWRRTRGKDSAWLLYSANYLFHTAGVRWALDPLTLRQRVPEAQDVDISRLSTLDAVVLTHSHRDHLDLDLLRRLQHLPIRWIVPPFLLEQLKELNLPPEKLTLAHHLEPVRLGALTLTPFESVHFEEDADYPGGKRGVPELGYLAEFNAKRWLFVGDLREFDASRLPSFGPVDGLFAHLWLGRTSALDAIPPLLPEFCRFCLDLQPRRIILTHLYEFARKPMSLWTERHARLTIAHFSFLSPAVSTSFARMGDRVDL